MLLFGRDFMIAQIAGAAIVLWLLQIALSYRQARLFAKRASELRKQGIAATGLAGGSYRGRVYVVLVAHPTTHLIVAAEQLKGFTVFATLKPISQLEGLSLETLTSPDILPIEGVPPKTLEAARSAASTIEQSFHKVATPIK
jgi:DNA-binding transcriptional regulator of glucitol operon